MRVTPENIVKRHEKFPEGTAQLIEYYANMKVVEHVRNLAKHSHISQLTTSNTVIIISDYDIWEKYKGHSPFAGLSVDLIQDYTKEIKE